MITVQETTMWDDNTPNHKYILSDDMMKSFGYIKVGDKYPYIFNKPMAFDKRHRTFKTVVRTKDVS